MVVEWIQESTEANDGVELVRFTVFYNENENHDRHKQLLHLTLA